MEQGPASSESNFNSTRRVSSNNGETCLMQSPNLKPEMKSLHVGKPSDPSPVRAKPSLSTTLLAGSQSRDVGCINCSWILRKALLH